MESQNVEYKASWKDEYIKWICGFANAQGGTLFIGVDDNGRVVGVDNVRKLLEDIPNKVREKLGIVVKVNALENNDKAYLEIVTPPSSFPINYNGEYHYRSGSTKQMLQGVALAQFLIEKTGITWDSVLMDDLTIDDFHDDDFRLFRQQALRSGRLDEEDMNLNKSQLLANLGLMKKGKIMRAALMAFHHNPEEWVNGAYVKIGYFESDDDLRYWDEVHGSLITQAERVIDLIYTKYLKADIAYEGVTRIETYPFPKAAIREAVYECRRNNVDLPKYTLHSDEIMVRFVAKQPVNPRKLHNELHNDCTITAQKLPDGIPTIVYRVLEAIAASPNATRKQLSNELKVSERTVSECIAILKRHGCIERVGGNKSGYWKLIKE